MSCVWTVLPLVALSLLPKEVTNNTAYRMCNLETRITDPDFEHKRLGIVLINGLCSKETQQEQPAHVTIAVCIPPKAGTSSFLNWLRHTSTLGSAPRVHHDLHGFQMNEWRGENFQLHASVTNNFKVYRDPTITSFVVVRHPVSRFLSAFKSKYFCGPISVFRTDRHAGPPFVKYLALHYNKTYFHHSCLKFEEYMDIMSTAYTKKRNIMVKMEPHTQLVSEYCELPRAFKNNITIIPMEDHGKLTNEICKSLKLKTPDFPCDVTEQVHHASKVYSYTQELLPFAPQAEMLLDNIRKILHEEMTILQDIYPKFSGYTMQFLTDIANILYQESLVNMTCVRKTFNKELLGAITRKERLNDTEVTCVKRNESES
eukprot:m.33932 g.33932  ORF g.33932 m.33932 type:complete len:372 (+) comp8630_c1_seq1:451-1566(+)